MIWNHQSRRSQEGSLLHAGLCHAEQRSTQNYIPWFGSQVRLFSRIKTISSRVFVSPYDSLQEGIVCNPPLTRVGVDGYHTLPNVCRSAYTSDVAWTSSWEWAELPSRMLTVPHRCPITMREADGTLSSPEGGFLIVRS